jgi:hypothetical protein
MRGLRMLGLKDARIEGVGAHSGGIVLRSMLLQLLPPFSLNVQAQVALYVVYRVRSVWVGGLLVLVADIANLSGLRWVDRSLLTRI